MRLLAVLCVVLVGAQGQGVGDFVKNLRSLTGAGLLRDAARECKAPLEEFGFCMVGREPNGRAAEPQTQVGRNIARKADRTMRRIRRDPEINRLEDIGRRVDQCFASCPLTPVKAVKCFLDFLMNGGPFDRVKQCVEASWGTGDIGQEPPKFGDLSSLEDDLKLFAGIGLYKRLFADHDKFWEKYGAQVENMCPGDGRGVQRCIDAAVGYPDPRPLGLDLERILTGSGVENTAAARSDLAQRLSVFGSEYDVKVFLSLVQYRVMACGLDLFGSGEEASLGSVFRIMRSNDPCAMPKCIHYVWTIKDALCNDCRTSLSKDGIDPFADVIPFLRSAADEFVDAVSSPGYRCKARDPTVCSGCTRAASVWKAQNTNVLQGFASEALVVTKLLKDVCDMGSGQRSLRKEDCPGY